MRIRSHQEKQDIERDKDGDVRRELGRRRPRPAPDLVFDYKEVDVLRQFVTEQGKIVPARVSRLSAKQQRDLAVAVKRARQVALLPYNDAQRT